MAFQCYGVRFVAEQDAHGSNESHTFEDGQHSNAKTANPAQSTQDRLGLVRYDLCRDLSCPLLSGPSTMTVWIKEGTTNASEEAQAGGDHRQAA